MHAQNRSLAELESKITADKLLLQQSDSQTIK